MFLRYQRSWGWSHLEDPSGLVVGVLVGFSYMGWFCKQGPVRRNSKGTSTLGSSSRLFANWNVWKRTFKTPSHTFETCWNTKPPTRSTIKRGKSWALSLSVNVSAMTCSPRMRWCRCCRWWGLGSCQSSCQTTRIRISQLQAKRHSFQLLVPSFTALSSMMSLTQFFLSSRDLIM